MQQQQHVPVDELFDYDDETAYRNLLREELAKNWSNGFCRMPDLVRQDRTLSPKAKIVYEQLLSYMWFESDHCWPSQQTLANTTGYSRRTVIRACKELYERGYIEKWRRGQGYTNYYFINPLTFPHSFRRAKREPVESMILSSSAPEVRKGITSCTPRSIDQALALCHPGTSRSDNVSQPKAPEWHCNQTKENDSQGKERSSNDSTSPQKGMDFPVVAQATRNEHGEYLLEEEGDIPHEASTDIHVLEQGALHPSDAKNNEPVPPSKPNSSPSSHSTQEGTAAGRAKDAYNATVKQTPQQVIAQTTGIPQSVLSEMGIAESPKKRPIPEFVRDIISRYSQELGDHPWCTQSNITHAAKLYFFARDVIIEAKDDPQGFFLDLLYQAKQAAYKINHVRYRNDKNRPNRMPAFFTCLENALYLSEAELLFIRSDEPLFERVW